MRKKLTITIDEKVYAGLYRTIGEGKISQFIERLVEPYVLPESLEMSYREMAMDEEREKEAKEWVEGVIENFKEETFQSWKSFQKTRLHLIHKEVCDWLKTWGTNKEKRAPKCHK